MNYVFYLHDEPSLEQFEKKIIFLAKRYNFISYETLSNSIRNVVNLKNTCHITVDDGWLSTYKVIYPIMTKYNIPFTIFVSPEICKTCRNFWYKDLVGADQNYIREMLINAGIYKTGIKKFPVDLLFKEISIDTVYKILDEYWLIHSKEKRSERSFINISELKEMHNSGLVEIGAHTLTHPILANENELRSEYEIIESISQLSSLLNKEITAFAYPNGLNNLDFGKREMDIVKKAGIKLAFSVNPGIINNKINPLAIPRIGSINRLRFGRLGAYLPSLTHQKEIRQEIKKYLV